MDQPINLGPKLHSSEMEIRGCVPVAQDKFHNNTKRRTRSRDGTIYIGPIPDHPAAKTAVTSRDEFPFVTVAAIIDVPRDDWH